LSNFVDLAYVYGRSNESVVHAILNRLGELNSDKVMEQFSESIMTISKHIKNIVRSLCSIAKSHYDKSGLTNTEDWPEKIKSILEDSIIKMNDMYIFAKYFPNLVSPTVWATDILIVLTNYYVLIKDHKPEIWEMYCLNKRSLDSLTVHLK